MAARVLGGRLVGSVFERTSSRVVDQDTTQLKGRCSARQQRCRVVSYYSAKRDVRRRCTQAKLRPKNRLLSLSIVHSCSSYTTSCRRRWSDFDSFFNARPPCVVTTTDDKTIDAFLRASRLFSELSLYVVARFMTSCASFGWIVHLSSFFVHSARPCRRMIII